MVRSPMKAAAISWVIACGLLCGGTGMFGAPVAAADPGTVGNSHGGPDTDGPSDINDARPGGRPGAHRPGGPRKPRGTDTRPGATRPDGGVVGRSHRPVETPGETPGGHWLPGWPFPPWPPCGGQPGGGVGLPRPPGVRIAPPPEAVGGGGGGGRIDLRPRTIPPGEPGQPGEPPVVSAEHGTVGPASLEPPPITMPPLIGLGPAFPPPMRPIGPGAEPGPRTGPGRESTTTRERPPATSAGAGTEMPSSTRVGYPRYLQEAKMGEVAALALPGFAGILALTALGGVVGYRQAKAGHVVRTAGTARFMQ